MFSTPADRLDTAAHKEVPASKPIPNVLFMMLCDVSGYFRNPNFPIEFRDQWRRRWDSNPRDPSGPTPLAGERLRPLGHVSVDPSNDTGEGPQPENRVFQGPVMRFHRQAQKILPSARL